jgi:hypothetical protein
MTGTSSSSNPGRSWTKKDKKIDDMLQRLGTEDEEFDDIILKMRKTRRNWASSGWP